MSKSLGEKHCLFLFEEESTLRKKIKTAVTDVGDTPEGQMSPGVENLFSIIKALGNQALYDSLMQEYLTTGKMYGKLKEGVAETVVPFTNQLKEIETKYWKTKISLKKFDILPPKFAKKHKKR